MFVFLKFIPDGTVVKPLSPIPTIRELQNWTDQHFKREELGVGLLYFLFNSIE